MMLTCIEGSEFSVWYASCHGTHSISQLDKSLQIIND